MNGRDRIEFNAGRVYGPILYPYMVTNWKFIWPLEGEAAPAKNIKQFFFISDQKRNMTDGSIVYQPVFIFTKQ